MNFFRSSILNFVALLVIGEALQQLFRKTSPSSHPHPSLSPALKDRTKLGNLDVPRLGIGTINWTPSTASEDAVIQATTTLALGNGLNFFDTAERYGAKPLNLVSQSISAIWKSSSSFSSSSASASATIGGDCETNIARWFNTDAGVRSKKPVSLATKFTPKPDRLTAQSVVDACRESARRLNVTQIPLYQIHFPDVIQPFARFGLENRKDSVYWDGLAECYHLGLAANVGVSNYGSTLVTEAQKYLRQKGVPLASNQICFSLLNRRAGSLATVETCKRLGVSVLAYYPLAMGLLTDKLSASTLRGRGDARSKDLLRYLEGSGTRNGIGGRAGKVPAGGVQPLLVALRAVATRVKKTPAQVALNYVICKGAIPIPGVSSPKNIPENLGALGWRLKNADVGLLDAAADALPFDFRGAGFQTTDSKFVGYGFEKWSLD